MKHHWKGLRNSLAGLIVSVAMSIQLTLHEMAAREAECETNSPATRPQEQCWYNWLGGVANQAGLQWKAQEFPKLSKKIPSLGKFSLYFHDFPTCGNISMLLERPAQGCTPGRCCPRSWAKCPGAAVEPAHGAGGCLQDAAQFHRQMEKADSHSWADRTNLLRVRANLLRRDIYGIIRSPPTICAGHWNCFLLHLWLLWWMEEEESQVLPRGRAHPPVHCCPFGRSEPQLLQGRFVVWLVGTQRTAMTFPAVTPQGWEFLRAASSACSGLGATAPLPRLWARPCTAPAFSAGAHSDRAIFKWKNTYSILHYLPFGPCTKNEILPFFPSSQLVSWRAHLISSVPCSSGSSTFLLLIPN